jgi:hypothetical protein
MGLLRSDETNTHSPVSASFDVQTGLILAHLDKVDYGFVDEPVRYQGKTFQPKSELHITLVSQDAGAILKHLESHPDDIDEIQDLVFLADFTFFKLGEFYHVEEQPGVEAIIQMVEIPGLRAFFKDLSKLVGQGFIVPPTHVTLYTRGTVKGISLPDQQAFQQFARAKIIPGEVQVAQQRTSPGAEQGLV